MSTADHLHTDGHAERGRCVVEDVLVVFVLSCLKLGVLCCLLFNLR